MTTEHAEGKIPRTLEHKVWACAIGLSQDSERVLRLASRAAAEAGAQLSVIHAAGNPDVPEVRRRLEELLRKAGCEAAVQIAAGPVKEALLEAASRSGADALIVERRPDQGSVGRLRDLTYALDPRFAVPGAQRVSRCRESRRPETSRILRKDIAPHAAPSDVIIDGALGRAFELGGVCNADVLMCCALPESKARLSLAHRRGLSRYARNPALLHFAH